MPKVFLYIIICSLFLSCNSNAKKQDLAKEEIEYVEPTENITERSNAEIIEIDSPIYQKISRGKYVTKSTLEQYISLADDTIVIHQVADSSKLNRDCYMYLANEKPLALFNKMHPSTKEDVGGLFLGGSLVQVDTIYYNAIYNDSDKAPMSFEDWYALIETEDSFGKYPLTYDVWYAVTINGKMYYTDYKLHDRIEVIQYLPSRKQILLICSQSTGYDGMYDRGYPDYYEVTVLEESKTKIGLWKRIYRSSKLDLNDGGFDEYGLSMALDFYEGALIDSQGNFDFNVACCFQMVWDGKELSITWTDEYLASIEERKRSTE